MHSYKSDTWGAPTQLMIYEDRNAIAFLIPQSMQMGWYCQNLDNDTGEYHRDSNFNVSNVISI